ncbi:uncharacterized protein [Triticum aestivum]|uniref:Uncharacterized protein n=1 Tax=Triticum turgidum subsp. durum TaxID=4567 RepID=A0A9R1PDJ0_TRITD|nr:uncharacterized protein LOC123043446 [Triticum aestivum]VAH41411.1 unnamed protein product [Triticum turgidum subsp. durum]
MRGSSLTTRKAGARLLGRIHGGSWADRRYGGEVEKKELAGAGRRQMGAGDGWIRPSGAKFLQVETGLVLRANAHLGRLRRLIAAVGVMNSDHGDSHALQRPELAEGHSTSSTSCLPHALLHPRPLLRTYATPSSSSSSMLHATSSLHPEDVTFIADELMFDATLQSTICPSEGYLKLKIEKMAINLMILCTKSQGILFSTK